MLPVLESLPPPDELPEPESADIVPESWVPVPES
jgi:hypothetical protein